MCDTQATKESSSLFTCMYITVQAVQSIRQFMLLLKTAKWLQLKKLTFKTIFTKTAHHLMFAIFVYVWLLSDIRYINIVQSHSVPFSFFFSLTLCRIIYTSISFAHPIFASLSLSVSVCVFTHF